MHRYLTETFNLTEEEAETFMSVFTKHELKKNDIFLTTGEVCDKIGLITSGLMKCIYVKNGAEIVFDIAYENCFIADYQSFLVRRPSAKEIVCLEDTVINVTTRQKLEELASKYSFISAMNEIMTTMLFLKMHDRAKSFLLDNATERYLKLLGERSDLINRVPQYLLASYLNIKPETLSRIRKKLASP